MRTQFSKTERRLNATEHGDDVDVLYTTTRRGNGTLSSREEQREEQRDMRGIILTWLLGRSPTRLS